MTIEEKAKAYDEAINIARDYHKRLLDDDNPEWASEIEKIFPELKESEKEQNIKNLIDELKCSLRAANCQNDACGGGHEKRIALLEWSIAWLEKQDKEVDVIENFDTEFEKQVSRLLASIINKDWEYTEGFVKWASNSLLGYAKHELGKQDEKKKELKEIAIPKSEADDKIEPRFKVGDWVVANYSGRVSQVIAVSEDGYGYQLDDGLCFGVSWCDIFHLWCIKDARDGDVLASDGSVFIFQDEYMAGKPIAYCGIVDGGF